MGYGLLPCCIFVCAVIDGLRIPVEDGLSVVGGAMTEHCFCFPELYTTTMSKDRITHHPDKDEL